MNTYIHVPHVVKVVSTIYECMCVYMCREMLFEQEERQRLYEEAQAHERAMAYAENQCTVVLLI
jgi:hypothetical protein